MRPCDDTDRPAATPRRPRPPQPPRPTPDLSAAIAATGGPFIRGPAPSLADALLFPFPARFAALAHHRGFTVPETPELAAYHGWVAAMRARPAVAATLSPDALYIDGYGALAVRGNGWQRAGDCRHAHTRHARNRPRPAPPCSAGYAAGKR